MNNFEDDKKHEMLTISRCERGFVIRPGDLSRGNIDLIYAFSTFKEAVEFIAHHLDE